MNKEEVAIVLQRLRRAVLVLLFFATLVRILPVCYDAPEGGLFSSDEIDSVARALKFATGDLLPIHANKPTHYVELLALAYGAQYCTEKLLLGTTREDFEKRYFLSPFLFYASARYMSVAFAVSTLALLLWSLRRHGLGAQLLAVVIMAFASSSVKYAHIAKEDSVATFWTFAALASALEALAARTANMPWRVIRQWVLFGSVAAGLAVSTKYNCFFAPLFPLFAAYDIWRNARVADRRPALVLCLTAVGAIAGGFVFGTPGVVIFPKRFVQATLASDIVSEVGHGLASLQYAEKYGLAFFGHIWFAELGIAWVGVAIAGWLFLSQAKLLRLIVGIPVGLYLITLLVAGHLDYQYVIVITPIAAWITGHEMTARALTPRGRVTRLLVMACLALGLLQNGWRVARRTAEYLGGDTRIVAARWLENYATENPSFRNKPLLIVAPYYYRYHPAVAFTPATYARLLEQARKEGREGGYFERAFRYSSQNPRPQFDAEFLNIRWHFRRQPDGRREFLPQPFSLDVASHLDKYAAICIPEATMLYLKFNPPEASEVVSFIRQITTLPLMAEFHPRPWRLAGPSVWIYKPRDSSEVTTVPLNRRSVEQNSTR